MGGIEIKVDLSQLADHAIFRPTWPKETQDLIEKRLTELFQAALFEMETDIPQRIPRGVTGNLRTSYVNSFIRGSGINKEAVFGSSLNYAEWVEEGTRPHFPPTQPLELWAVRVLGVKWKDAKRIARSIALKIAKFGTRPDHTVRNWFFLNRELVFDNINKGFDRIAAEIEAKA